ERWLKNRKPTRDAFPFFPSSPPETAEDWLRKIQRDAEIWMHKLESAQVDRGLKADIKRAAFSNLGHCCVTLAEPPPPALVELIRGLMGVRPQIGLVKNLTKFHAAAKFEADNPGCTLSKIKRAVKADHNVLKRWRQMPEYRLAIARYLQSKKNRKIR